MTDVPRAVEHVLNAHDAFDRTNGGYDLQTTIFDTYVTARVRETGDSVPTFEFNVTITLPMLSAVTKDDVAPIVEDDWIATLTQRLKDVYRVAQTDVHERPNVERDGPVAHVDLTYESADTAEGAEDAKRLIEYVEGTYAQGIIPGYEYVGEPATLLERAATRSEEATEESGQSR